MNQDFSGIYTTSVIILFLTILLAIAFFIKRKSNSIKKIINHKKKINILEFLPVRGGLSAIIFSVNNEEFFFVGHKSGNGNLVQIINSKNNYLNNDSKDNKISKNKIIEPIKSEKKPLEHVNISDLLALHKKG